MVTREVRFISRSVIGVRKLNDVRFLLLKQCCLQKRLTTEAYKLPSLRHTPTEPLAFTGTGCPVKVPSRLPIGRVKGKTGKLSVDPLFFVPTCHRSGIVRALVSYRACRVPSGAGSARSSVERSRLFGWIFG